MLACTQRPHTLKVWSGMTRWISVQRGDGGNDLGEGERGGREREREKVRERKSIWVFSQKVPVGAEAALRRGRSGHVGAWVLQTFNWRLLDIWHANTRTHTHAGTRTHMHTQTHTHTNSSSSNSSNNIWKAAYITSEMKCQTWASLVQRSYVRHWAGLYR